MDTSDIGNINYNELYKLHTGHGVYDSDTDSSDSATSSSFFQRYKPPLYTYEELKANSVVIEPISNQSETGSNDIGSDCASKALGTVAKKSLKETRQKRLKELTLPNYCYVCYADLPNPNNAFSHYHSLRHQNNVRDWKDKSLYRVLQEKLETLIGFDYCYICCADLPQVANAQSHYNSKRHKMNLDIWKSKKEITKLPTTRMDTLVPNTVEKVQKIPVQNQANKITRGQFDKLPHEIVQERLLNLVCSDYCYLCYADLREAANAQSHYNSKRHKDNLAAWISSEITTLQTPRMDTSVPNTVEQVQKIPAGQANKIDTMIVTNQNVGIQNSCQNVKPSVHPVCLVCGISLGTGLQDHYKSDLHKRCLEAFCVKTMSKEHLTEHVNGIGHKKNLETKDKVIDSLIVPQIIVTPEIKKETKGVGELCKTEKKETSKPNWEDRKKIVDNNANIFYCYACKINFRLQSELTLHSQSFPHNYVAKLKSSVISRGISTQAFWKIVQNWQIWCSLCQASLQCESSARDHLRCSRHVDNFNTWCREQPKDTKDPNRKWHYCDLCKISLDGTTNAELHYQRHSTREKNTTNALQATSASISAGMLKTETRDVIKLKNISKKQEETQIVSEKPKLQNKDLNTNVPNGNDIPADNENKKQIKMKQNSEKAKLENQNTKESNNETFIDDDKKTLCCYLCKKQFNSQNNLNDHIGSYPHNSTAKLKSLAVSEDSASVSNFPRSSDVNTETNKIHNELKATEKIRIESEGEMLQPEHHFEGETHAEKQKLYTEISQTSTTSRHSNISKTDSASVSNSPRSSDVNTESNKNDNTLKATEEILIESEGEMLLQLQPEHHYEGETHAEKQKIFTEISQTSTTSRPSNISITDSASVSNSPRSSDVNTETNKNDNTLKEKIRIASESEMLSQPEHHYEGETHAEKRKIYTEIAQTSTTSRPSNISKTDSASVSNFPRSSDVNTETNKNDNELKATEKIRIESEGKMLLQPEHHYEGETHAEKQKIYTEISQTCTTSRPSNISKTGSASVTTSPHSSDVNTKTNKNDNELKATEKIEIESEGEKLLQEMVDAEMTKLKTVVESIPPNTAVTILRKFIKELENFKKKPEAPTVNAEQVVNTRKGSKDILSSNLLIKNRFEHDNPKENQKLNSSVVAEPKASKNRFRHIWNMFFSRNNSN